MSGFYSDLAAMTRDLLQPDSAGGLGQGPVTLTRTTPGVPDPAKPWLPVTPTITTATANQIGTGKNEYRAGETIVGVDVALMIEPPAGMIPAPGDTVEKAGVRIGTVVRADRFPAAGDVPVYWDLFINR